MELDLGPRKSWKVMENKPNACHITDPCTCFRPLCTLSLPTVRLGSMCFFLYNYELCYIFSVI